MGLNIHEPIALHRQYHIAVGGFVVVVGSLTVYHQFGSSIRSWCHDRRQASRRDLEAGLQPQNLDNSHKHMATESLTVYNACENVELTETPELEPAVLRSRYQQRDSSNNGT